MQERILIGRITGLRVFRVPDFGTRASFRIERTGQCPVICSVAGDVAREFIAYYCEGDIIAVRAITNRDQRRPPPIHHGPAAFESAPCACWNPQALPHEDGMSG